MLFSILHEQVGILHKCFSNVRELHFLQKIFQMKNNLKPKHFWWQTFTYSYIQLSLHICDKKRGFEAYLCKHNRDNVYFSVACRLKATLFKCFYQTPETIKCNKILLYIWKYKENISQIIVDKTIDHLRILEEMEIIHKSRDGQDKLDCHPCLNPWKTTKKLKLIERLIFKTIFLQS